MRGLIYLDLLCQGIRHKRNVDHVFGTACSGRRNSILIYGLVSPDFVPDLSQPYNQRIPALNIGLTNQQGGRKKRKVLTVNYCKDLTLGW